MYVAELLIFCFVIIFLDFLILPPPTHSHSHRSSGMAYYINNTLVPELVVQRDQAYVFIEVHNCVARLCTVHAISTRLLSLVDNWVREFEVWCPAMTVIAYWGECLCVQYCSH